VKRDDGESNPRGLDRSADTTRAISRCGFRGAGGLHACELAQGLGIPRVIVPVLPGRSQHTEFW